MPERLSTERAQKDPVEARDYTGAEPGKQNRNPGLNTESSLYGVNNDCGLNWQSRSSGASATGYGFSIKDNAPALGGPSMNSLAPSNHPRFVLTEGGPAHRLEIRLGLIRANSPHILQRSFICILVTWVPLLVLSELRGNAIGHLVSIPFLHDFAVHARFLLAVPILLLADAILGPRLAHAASHFLESGLVAEEKFVRFDAAIESGLRWRDSTLAELVLISLAYTLTTINLPVDGSSCFHLVRGKDGFGGKAYLVRLVVRTFLRPFVPVPGLTLALAPLPLGTVFVANESSRPSAYTDTPRSSWGIGVRGRIGTAFWRCPFCLLNCCGRRPGKWRYL
jgi:hypothetical protein